VILLGIFQDPSVLNEIQVPDVQKRRVEIADLVPKVYNKQHVLWDKKADIEYEVSSQPIHKYFDLIGVPTEFALNLSKNHPDLYKTVLDRFTKGTGRCELLIRDESVVRLLHDSGPSVSAHKFLELAKRLAGSVAAAKVSFSYTDDNMNFTLFDKDTMFYEKDPHVGGIYISASAVGATPTMVGEMLLREVCTNGTYSPVRKYMFKKASIEDAYEYAASRIRDLISMQLYYTSRLTSIEKKNLSFGELESALNHLPYDSDASDEYNTVLSTVERAGGFNRNLKSHEWKSTVLTPIHASDLQKFISWVGSHFPMDDFGRRSLMSYSGRLLNKTYDCDTVSGINLMNVEVPLSERWN
jgi:hypothetical protein